MVLGWWRSMRLVLAGAAVLLSQVVVFAPQAELPAAGATELGGLPTQDPKLVFDQDQGRWASLSSGDTVSADRSCNPADNVWSKGYANVPFRVGPTPDQLRPCWEGDAMPNGPGGSWATPNTVRSPSIARIDGVWWLVFTARNATTGQRCIATGGGNSPTGPGWFLAAEADVCPENGSANDPEIFFDVSSGRSYLLWQEQDALGCGSKIVVEELLAGDYLGDDQVILLDAGSPVLRFDDLAPNADCPSGRHRIGDPTMIRSSNGSLSLFFSGNDPDSINEGIGWALCGGAGDAPGDVVCTPSSALDPEGDYYRPAWGHKDRTRPNGSPAPPYSKFPETTALGGLSLTVKDPSLNAPQPVFATADAYVAGSPPHHRQHVFRLDVADIAPALYETETVVHHGAPLTFGSAVPGRAPSGQPLALRDVRSGFAWPAGVDGALQDVTRQGTIVVAGLDQNHTAFKSTADETVLGTYDPKVSEWENVPIRTMGGSTTVSPFTCGSTAVDPMQCTGRPVGSTVPAGGLIGDVQAIEGGDAVAFVITYGHPTAYWDNPAPPEGDWPTFGVVDMVGGEWKVATGQGWANQWSGGQLAASNPPTSTQACPVSPRVPAAGESFCRGPNEMALLPASKHLIVSQYLGNEDPVASAGLMALNVSPRQPNGRRSVEVGGHYEFPAILNPMTPDPDDLAVLLAKEVQVDPTGQLGDERFTVIFDMVKDADDDLWNFEDSPSHVFYEGPPVLVEYSYNSFTGAITPVTGLLLPGLHTDPTEPKQLAGMGTATFDNDGNVWASSSELVVYTKGRFDQPECRFDGELADDVTVDGDRGVTIVGRLCEPDFVIEAGHTDEGPFTNQQIKNEPGSNTMVVFDGWDEGITPIRYDGAGRNMVFTVGNTVDTGAGAFGVTDRFYGAFDGTGRVFLVERKFQGTGPDCDFGGETLPWYHPRCPGVEPYQSTTHWVSSIDIDRLWEPTPILLGATPHAEVTVQAEQTTTYGTTVAPGTPNGPIVVDAVAHMRRTTDAASPDSFELAQSDDLGHSAGTVDYQVYAPTAGNYRVEYRIDGSAGSQLELAVGGQTYDTSIATTGWQDKAVSVAVPLPAGTSTLRLTPTAGHWRLQYIRLIRV